MKADRFVRQRRANQGGFLLIEVMVAILIFSIGILAVVGLQAVMIKNATDARYRSTASYIAEQRIAQIWAEPTNINAYLEAATDISDRLPAGTRTVVQPVAGRVQVTVTWQQPGSDPHRLVTVAQVTGGG